MFAFKGVYQNAWVDINGNEAGGAAYGYIPFTVYADRFIRYGQQNTFRVEAGNSASRSRWTLRLIWCRSKL
ncbi:MAG: hypothetical protein LBS11_04385 [Oscillospiraceae bacterium]|nr:hypothetical protein [Oscillospiraceae bacterium]